MLFALYMNSLISTCRSLFFVVYSIPQFGYGVIFVTLFSFDGSLKCFPPPLINNIAINISLGVISCT